VRFQPLFVTVHRPLDRPAETHRYRNGLAFFVFQFGYDIPDFILAGGFDLCHFVRAVQVKRNHNLVGKGPFRHGSQGIRPFNFGADFDLGGKFPSLVRGQGVQVDAPFQEVTGRFGKLRQGVLQAVVDLAQQARPQLYRQHVPGEFHLIANGNTLGDFKDLELAYLAANPDYFAFQPFVGNFYITDLVHGNSAVKVDADHIAVNGYYRSFCSNHLDSPAGETPV